MSPHLAANLSQSIIPGGALTISEFCAWACIGKTKAYAEVKAGRLQLRKIGAKSIILRADAEAWLRDLPVVGTTA